MDDFDNERTALRKRPLGLAAENDFVAECRDPYGYWYLSRERGQIPPVLQGAYTTIEAATDAARAYAVYKDVPSAQHSVKK